MPIPRFVLVRETTLLTDEELYAFAGDEQLEITQNYAPHWGNAIIQYVKPGDMIPGGAIQVLLQDHAPTEDEGDLGFHTVTPDGWPICRVFIADANADGIQWSVSVDHEIKETIADLYGTSTVQHIDGIGIEWRYALETCDAVEDDQFSHHTGTNGYRFSDFVLPSYFNDGPAPWSFGNKLSGPFTTVEGGFASRLRISPPTTGVWDQNMHADKAPTSRQTKGWWTRSARRWKTT